MNWEREKLTFVRSMRSIFSLAKWTITMGRSIIFVEYDRLQQQKPINQPDFLFKFQEVSVGGHVVVEFTLCFRWIVEKRPCFDVNDHHRSPVSSCFSSGNVDELLFLLMNRRTMSLVWIGCAVCHSWVSTYWELLKMLSKLAVVKNWQKWSIFKRVCSPLLSAFDCWLYSHLSIQGEVYTKFQTVIRFCCCLLYTSDAADE